MAEERDVGPGFVSARRLALEWDTTPGTVRRLLREAGVEAYRMSSRRGGLVRYRRSDVETFLARARDHSGSTDDGLASKACGVTAASD